MSGGFLPRPDPFLPTLAGYEVQRVTGYQAVKVYVCPSCHNPISVGDGHVVAWPHDAVDDRRHWHHHCWRIAAGRGRIA